MEKQTEKLKCELARQPDMSLYSAFKIFDTKNDGYINYEEFFHKVIQLTNKEYNKVLRE